MSALPNASKMSSHLDNSFYPFDCDNCGTRFKTVLRMLVHSVEVRCPHCHSIMDIRANKHAGDISKALAKAAQQDQASVTRN